MTLEISIAHAYRDFVLDVVFGAPGGITALFGRSGSGKTSIIKAVAGLLKPDSGRIAIDGEVLFDSRSGTSTPTHRRRIGYVFQDGRLFPHLTVRGNLAYGQRRRDRAELSRVADLLGLGQLLDRRPGRLSGGEAQRVAIGRALLADSRLLLMDEPLSSLDEPRRAEILPYLERLRDETCIPILYVSHTLAEVARLATTVVALRDGRVVRAGPTAEVLSDPAAVPALGVRAAGSALRGRVLVHHPDGLTEIEVSAGTLLLPRIAAEVGKQLSIRIAAQDIILSRGRPEGLSALNILPAVVTDLHRGEGPGVAVALRAGGDVLLARITRRSAEALRLAPGVSCHAIMKALAVAPEDVAMRGGDASSADAQAIGGASR